MRLKNTLLATLFALALCATAHAQQNLALDSATTATASSTYSANFPASAAIDGDRSGFNWGAGGGWNDATRGVFPDYLTITFGNVRLYAISHVTVTTLQDAFQTPVEPTATQTCTLYGVKDFDIQYFDGTNWQTAPGGSVTGNTLCKRDVVFTSKIRTNALRMVVNSSWDGLFSRVVEFEAFN